MMVIKFWLLILSVFIGYTLGWYLTEKDRLADKHRLFQFKAFECRKCLSFHIAWVISTSIALLMGDWIMLTIGIAFAFILFIGLRIDEKEKTITL